MKERPMTCITQFCRRDQRFTLNPNTAVDTTFHPRAIGHFVLLDIVDKRYVGFTSADITPRSARGGIWLDGQRHAKVDPLVISERIDIEGSASSGGGNVTGVAVGERVAIAF